MKRGNEENFGYEFLERFIEWARVNLDPSDIFGDEELKKSVHSLTRIVPDDVFDDSELEAWAEDNGFVKEDGDG